MAIIGCDKGTSLECSVWQKPKKSTNMMNTRYMPNRGALDCSPQRHQREQGQYKIPTENSLKR